MSAFPNFPEKWYRFVGHNLWYIPIDKGIETKGYNILCLHNCGNHKILCFLSLTILVGYYILCTERVREGDTMDIHGIQKLTLLDYPGKCACTVFLAGCNLRCPFCHNAPLVTGQAPVAMGEEELLAFLKKRRGLLDGVCITGGEPTLRPDLPEFIRRIKDLGYLVKLDTNGSNPDMLRRLIGEKILDYVAMDIKNSPENYSVTCGGVDILSRVEESLAILKENNVEYELRTTLCRPFHDESAMEAIGKWLSGTKNYYLQAFVDSGDLVGAGVSGFTEEEMKQLQTRLLPYIPNTRIRGI